MNKNEIICKIEQLKKYNRNLETKLCDYDDVIAQRDELKEQISTGIANLDSMKTKQTCMFNELISKHDKLRNDYNMQKEQLLRAQQDKDQIQRENNQLQEKIEDQEIAIEKLKNKKVNLLENTQNLEKQLLDAQGIKTNLQDTQQKMALELKVKDQDIICLQNTLSEKITQQIRLEKNVSTEQDRNECLRSTISKQKLKNEEIVRCLQNEGTELQNELNEKLAELATIKRKLKDKQEEIETEKIKTTELKKAIRELRDAYYKEKCKTENELIELKAKVKSMACDLTSNNTKLCDAQIESIKLKCQLKDQEEMIKLLESTKEQLQHEMRRIKDSIESTTTMFKSERKQYDTEKKNSERKLEIKIQEECELNKLIKKQSEQIRQLQKKKCTLMNSATLYAPDTTGHDLETPCITIIGSENEDKAKSTSCKSDKIIDTKCESNIEICASNPGNRALEEINDMLNEVTCGMYKKC